MAKRRSPPDIPSPERAADFMLVRCREEIESTLKSLLRRAVLPLIKLRLGVSELGEGFHWGRNIQIGPGSRVGRYAYLGEGFEAHGPVVVGDLCMIAAGCKIVGADHLYDILGTPTRLAFPEGERPVTIFGADVWAGQRVTIMEGLTIGAGAVIGSGTIVTKNVPPYAIIAGVPAKIIKWRFSDDEIKVHHRAITGDQIL